MHNQSKSENDGQAIEVFRCYIAAEVDENKCLDDSDVKHLSDGEAMRIMANLTKGQTISGLSAIPKAERDLLLRDFKAVSGLSLRQIARLTGLGYQTVNRA